MGDRVFLVPGGPDVIRGMAVPLQILQDLTAISTIPIEQIDAIAAALDDEAGFVSRSHLADVVLGIVKNDEQATAVVSALYSVHPDRVSAFLETVQRWRGTSKSGEQRLSDEALVAIQEKLPRLIREYPSVSRSRKADRLTSILGNEAESVELICDVRPVFNSHRDAIEGLIPLLTLKVSYECQDGGDQVLEVGLSQEMFEAMCDQVEKAKRKMEVLDRSVSQWIPGGLVRFEE